MTDRLEPGIPGDYLTRLAESDLGRGYKTRVMRELGLEPGAFVVDLGCGPGADLTAMAEAVGPSGRVLGIDHDPVAVATARHTVAALPRVSVMLCDLQHLGVANGAADAVHTDLCHRVSTRSAPASPPGSTSRGWSSG